MRSSTSARIVAELVKGQTAVTNIAHAFSASLYPKATRSAASFAVGGSRLKSAEVKSVEVSVGQDACLSMTTVQETKVLKSNRGASFSKQFLGASIESGGLFVHVTECHKPRTGQQTTPEPQHSGQPRSVRGSRLSVEH